MIEGTLLAQMRPAVGHRDVGSTNKETGRRLNCHSRQESADFGGNLRCGPAPGVSVIQQGRHWRGRCVTDNILIPPPTIIRITINNKNKNKNKNKDTSNNNRNKNAANNNLSSFLKVVGDLL